MEVDRVAPATIYAGGWLKQFEIPQPMILHISDDGGDTWTEFEGPAEFGGIWDMVQIDRPLEDRLSSSSVFSAAACIGFGSRARRRFNYILDTAAEF